jgi:glycopeptide antibiotics resistance protein
MLLANEFLNHSAQQVLPKSAYNLLTDIVPMMVLFVIVAVVLRIITNLYSHSKFDIYHDLKALVYVLYVFLLFLFVTTKDFQSYSNNFIPFREIFRYKNIQDPLFIWNIGGNICLFIPFGFIVADLINLKSGKHSFWLSALVVFITSLSIEIIQTYIGRSFDIDDIILNVLGGIIGYYVFRLFFWMFNKVIKNKIIKKTCFILFVIITFVAIYIWFR